MIFLILALAGVFGNESVSVGASQTIGTCSCDLTAGSCDLNCCCDNDCAGSVVSYWTSQNVCIVVPGTATSDQCSSKSSQTLEAGWRGMKVATDLVNRVLCVAIDNSPPSTNFFQVISNGTNYRLYNTAATSLQGTLTQNNNAGFSPEDFLYAKTSDFSYVWVLPSPDVYGICGYSVAVQWLSSFSLTSCVVYFDPSSQCSEFDYTNFLYQIGPGSKTNFVQTSVRSTFMRNENQMDSNLFTTNPPSAVYANNTCYNAVVQATYTVTSVTQTTITSVVVDFVLQNIVDSKFQMNFAVNFVTNSTGVVYKSGNPGYQIGKSIVTGVMDSSNYITYYDSPFQIPGINNDGSCGSGTHYNSPVLEFGKDSLFSCYLELNYSQLSNFCTATSNNKPDLFFSNDLLTLLGKYGFINYSYQDDWVNIVNGSSSTTRSFDSNTHICKLDTLLTYYITYANIGNVRNPQFKIIYAQRDFTSGGFWQYKMKDQAQTQKFLYTLSINFIQYPLNTFQYFPPAPNPLPVMPDDIMYPFKTSQSVFICFSLSLIFSI